MTSQNVSVTSSDHLFGSHQWCIIHTDTLNKFYGHLRSNSPICEFRRVSRSHILNWLLAARVRKSWGLENIYKMGCIWNDFKEWGCCNPLLPPHCDCWHRTISLWSIHHIVMDLNLVFEGLFMAGWVGRRKTVMLAEKIVYTSLPFHTSHTCYSANLKINWVALLNMGIILKLIYICASNSTYGIIRVISWSWGY